MKFEDLSAELQEKAKTCKTPEEMLALAKEEGMELSEDALEAVSGGMSWDCITDCSEHCTEYVCTDYCWSDYR